MKPPSPDGVRIGTEVVGQVVDHRVHVAELAPDLVRRGAVEVDLEVVVLAVDGPRLRALVVVGQTAEPGAAGVRQRDQVLNLQRDRVDHAGGNLVAGEGRAAGAVRVAGERVVDRLQRAAVVGRAAEVAAAQPRVGHAEERGQAVGRACSLRTTRRRTPCPS